MFSPPSVCWKRDKTAFLQQVWVLLQPVAAPALMLANMQSL